MKIIRSHTAEETIEIGKQIGSKARSGGVLFLFGGLGAGKTTLCKGIAAGLGVSDIVTSPTYTIINEYRGNLLFVHMDAYRLSGETDFREAGGEDQLGRPGTFCAVEWSERIPSLAESGAEILEIETSDIGERTLKLTGAWLEGIF